MAACGDFVIKQIAEDQAQVNIRDSYLLWNNNLQLRPDAIALGDIDIIMNRCVDHGVVTIGGRCLYIRYLGRIVGEIFL